MTLNKVFLAGTIAASVLFTACEKDENEDDINEQDRNFTVQASFSNRAEIEMGNIALQRASDASVRTYAQLMIREHTSAQNELLDIRDDLDMDVRLNDSLPASLIAMRNTMAALSGRRFDSAYMVSQVMAHQMSRLIFETETTTGSNGRVVAYANKYLPNIRMHFMMADTIAARVSK